MVTQEDFSSPIQEMETQSDEDVPDLINDGGSECESIPFSTRGLDLLNGDIPDLTDDSDSKKRPSTVRWNIVLPLLKWCLQLKRILAW